MLVAITLATRGLPRFRPALIALMAISIMQSMETANTYLSYNYLPTTSGAFRARSRTTTAGAIIKAVAQIFLVAIIGVRDESITVYEKETRAKGGPKAPGAPSPPQGAMETTPETVGVRPGRIAPPPTTTSVSPV